MGEETDLLLTLEAAIRDKCSALEMSKWKPTHVCYCAESSKQGIYTRMYCKQGSRSGGGLAWCHGN